LAAVDAGRALQVWNVDRDQKLLDIPDQVDLAVVSPTGAYVAIASGGAVKVLEISSGASLTRRAAPARLGFLGFSSDGRRLIAGMGRRLELWIWRSEDLVDAGCERLRANAASTSWSALLPAGDAEKVCTVIAD